MKPNQKRLISNGKKIIIISGCDFNDLASLFDLFVYQVSEGTPTSMQIKRVKQEETHILFPLE